MVASEPGGLTGQDKISDPRETKSTLTTKVYPEVAANAVLVLLAVACALLNRQVSRLAEDFKNQGGFSERLYRVRSRKRGF